MNASDNTDGPCLPIPTTWCMAFALEGLLIVLGNLLTLVVFWRRKQILKRTTYFLINLAMADSIVGLSTLLFSGSVILSNEVHFRAPSLNETFSQINLISIAASILSLACIALERVFAFVRPLEHRTTKTRYYYYAVGFVWCMALLMCASAMLGVHVFDFPKLGVYISVFVYGTCLVVISISYVVIWWAISQRPAPEVLQRKQNRKVAVTISAITFLSLVTFIPGQICLMLEERGNFHYVGGVAWVLVYVNSLVNPFVYVLNMPEFRREVVMLLGCKKRYPERPDVKSTSSNVQGLTLKSTHDIELN